MPFAQSAFPVLHSSSVMEHVGGWEDPQAFAQEIRRVGDRYRVQTPNRRFQVEPHLMALFVHYLPEELQRRCVCWLTVWGLVTRPSSGDVDAFLRNLTLLRKVEMRRLFPDAEIYPRGSSASVILSSPYGDKSGMILYHVRGGRIAIREVIRR